ncbi:SET-domain-containing protein [Mycena venus]|uniref:SET-domain-containing protein n=1 Tax=Mycena venus TaxID=2733690 RepID=A0A8H6XDW8_9AGAR|nr:SET-domain-containing protein [Mycena venus]
MADDDYETKMKEIEEFVGTAMAVYEKVRKEYNAWKKSHTAKVLAGLAHPDGFSSFSSTSSSPLEQYHMPRPCFDPLLDADVGDATCMYVDEYDSDENIFESEVVRIDVYDVVESFHPHPSYQYCTPASRNENARMIDNRNAPFVPFPEDPTFPRDQYLSYFQAFQWVDDQQDPDEEVIQYETVRRLHIDCGFEAEVINNVLKQYTVFRPLRLSNESGLLWDVSQRDLPNVVWADGPSSSKPKLPLHFAQEFPNKLGDIFNQINKGVAKFCPNQNCLTHNCHVHIDQGWEMYTPAFVPKQPRHTSEALRALADGPCGNDCFVSSAEDAMEDDSAEDCFLVPEDVVDVLSDVLKLEPDMLPCYLAVICKTIDRQNGDSFRKMTCRQAFVLRKKMIRDEKVVQELDDKDAMQDDRQIPVKKRRKRKLVQTKPKKPKSKRKRINVSGKVLPSPCAHSGPCSNARVCICFKQKTHCERNCRCDDNCVRRWPGCNSTCARNSRCSGRRCLCRAVGRECDPDLCTMCDARNMDTQCMNVVLTQRKFKRFEVKEAKYGLGAFALEEIRKEDIIGEYVGELLDNIEEKLDHRAIIQQHSDLNYCFGMGESKRPGKSDVAVAGTTVDAQWLGNPTRFLNDSKPRPANCVADELVVNGERRLLIRAVKNVKKGAELTLRYGDDYWKHAKNGGGP